MSANNVKIAYIGGGSRGWAWNLMSDLAEARYISGQVSLYDIDFEAAKHNEIIGNKIKEDHPGVKDWTYKAEETLEGALTGADVVVISILPGTFNEMGSDVHTPEKYGIYQSVGDTVGPGGIVRALRTIPMFEKIALAVKEFCPNAWVINYTNPMTICVRTLYKVFPEIKAFGCCHEVFATQRLLATALDVVEGIKDVNRREIKTDITGVNHFTWVTGAHYKDMDLFPVYDKFIEKVLAGEYITFDKDGPKSLMFHSHEFVKMDLYKRYGAIAAAGDRHLAEFVPIEWYMKDKETVDKWGYGLTDIDWRWKTLKEKREKSRQFLTGEKPFELGISGEEGVLIIEALLGYSDFISNVNVPNMGQISNLPLGVVVETNASFRTDTVTPMVAGPLPDSLYGLIAPIVAEQEMVVEAGLTRDIELAFRAFAASNHMPLSVEDARKLFDEMIENTKEYLTEYKLP